MEELKCTRTVTQALLLLGMPVLKMEESIGVLSPMFMVTAPPQQHFKYKVSSSTKKEVIFVSGVNTANTNGLNFCTICEFCIYV